MSPSLPPLGSDVETNMLLLTPPEPDIYAGTHVDPLYAIT
jgi:hypothetical protein